MKKDFSIKFKQDLRFKIFKLKEANFKIWHSKIETEENLAEQMQKHFDPMDKHGKARDILFKLFLEPSTPLIAKNEEKGSYIRTNKNEIAIMPDKADEDIINKIIAQKLNN